MYRVIHRLNQQSAPVRVAADTGHGAYDRPPPTRSDQPGWQLPVCKPEGPEHDMAVLQANLQRAQQALKKAELERSVLASIELDVTALQEPPRKKKTVGKSGTPQEAA
jgi:hypothetical protein